MMPIFHLLIGIVASVALYGELGWAAFLVLAISVLADADHYVYYVVRYGDKNVRSAYSHFMHMYDSSDVFLALHSFELVLAFFIMSLFSVWAAAIFIGLGLHMLCDLFGEVFYKNTHKNFSVLYYFVRR